MPTKTRARERRENNAELDRELSQTAQGQTMTDAGEIKHLFADLKDSITGEIKALRAAFTEFRAETERDMKKVMQQNTELKRDAETTNARVLELEARVSELEDENVTHQKTVKQCNSLIVEMGDQMDYIENKSRQNNVCIYNIAERSEGNDVNAFVQKLFKEALRMETVPQITRAHRIGAWKEGGHTRRPIIKNLVNYDGKRDLLKAAWSKKEILFNGARIYMDHDFTTRVKQQRAAYRKIREHLRHHKIKSHILAPARLKVFNADGNTTIYANAEEARRDLEQRGIYTTEGGAEAERPLSIPAQ
ncbi:uncharacterized protein LOC117557980 [Xyrichtys novacula]|uniref:Uncharacterized protein LOC117557980 n=1 Tax=Xyrichtys novacula TaxID=13765 RepID=A0AAV1FAQ6_XYRNO|nr:uncharacterized protein LOC117557980 [Xyrichtys novacula]